MTAPVILAAMALWAGGTHTTVASSGYGDIGGWAAAGSAATGTGSVWLSDDTMRLAARGSGTGVFVLLHEVRHTQQQVGDECDADRWGLRLLRPTIHHFWPRWRPARLRAEYREARAFQHATGHGCPL